MATDNTFLSGDIGNTAALDPAEFEKLFTDIIEGTPIKEGSVVTGKVIRIQGDLAIVDISYKSEGAIPVREFRGKDGMGTVDVGDDVSCATWSFVRGASSAQKCSVLMVMPAAMTLFCA